MNQGNKTKKEPSPSKLIKFSLSDLGSGEHVDLPITWNEAIMLSQCKCDIQKGVIFLNYIFVNYFKPF